MGTGNLILATWAVCILMWIVPHLVLRLRENLRSHTPEWREARLRAWIMKELPEPPEETDWGAYERVGHGTIRWRGLHNSALGHFSDGIHTFRRDSPGVYVQIKADE